MIQQRIIDELPEIYHGMFPEFFQELIPKETLATCAECAMCSKEGEPRFPEIGYFSPNSKCCTYHPKLPNYLIGALLMDSNPAMNEGRRRIREIIRLRIGVNPQGIFAPKKYLLLQKHSEKGFGKNSTLLCPFYIREVGSCSIWKFREVVCSTYFCKSVAGAEGKKFWNALKAYLNHAQECLVWYALDKLNWDIEKLSEYVNNYDFTVLDGEDLDGLPPSEESYRALWSDWAGREEDFYMETFRLVKNLSREEFERAGGISQQVFLNWLRKKRQSMISPEIPAILKKNPALNVYRIDEETCVVQSPSGFFKIKSILNEVLQLFDGQRSNDEVAQLISDQHGESLEKDLLVSLYQNRVLVPVEKQTSL